MAAVRTKTLALYSERCQHRGDGKAHCSKKVAETERTQFNLDLHGYRTRVDKCYMLYNNNNLLQTDGTIEMDV